MNLSDSYPVLKRQSTLRVLRLGGNNFTGPLPTSWGGLQLTDLDLSNMLTPVPLPFPPQYAAIANLTRFNLHNAGLVGVLPNFLINIKNVYLCAPFSTTHSTRTDAQHTNIHANTHIRPFSHLLIGLETLACKIARLSVVSASVAAVRTPLMPYTHIHTIHTYTDRLTQVASNIKLGPGVCLDICPPVSGCPFPPPTVPPLSPLPVCNGSAWLIASVVNDGGSVIFINTSAPLEVLSDYDQGPGGVLQINVGSTALPALVVNGAITRSDQL